MRHLQTKRKQARSLWAAFLVVLASGLLSACPAWQKPIDAGPKEIFRPSLLDRG